MYLLYALGGIGLLLFFAVAIRDHLAAAARRREAWQTAVRMLSRDRIGDHNGSPGFDLITTDGVHLMCRSRGKYDPFGFVADGLPPELHVSPEGFAHRLNNLLLGSDIETGDGLFDEAILIRGSEARVLALCDERTRALLVAAVREGATIGNGELRRPATYAPTSFEEILGPASDVSALARVIEERSSHSVPVLLRQNAAGDPIAGVRLRCLEVLGAQFPDHPETRAALEAAAADPDGAIRLLAAARNGRESADELGAIVGDSSVSSEVRADAMKRLLAAHPGARSVSVAERALSDRSPAVRAVAIDAIGRARRTTTTPALVALALKAEDEGEMHALAQAFWRMRDPAAEAALLRLFERGKPEVRLEAARALARCGGIASVEPLLAVRGLLSGELGRVAGEAITAIQGRLRNAGEGQLTVSEPGATEGQVSIKDDRGAVSVVRRKNDPA